MNQLRKMSNAPPLILNSCLSRKAYFEAVASNGDGGHAGFTAGPPPGEKDCNLPSDAQMPAEGAGGFDRCMPYWAMVQYGLCMFAQDGHLGIILNPKTKYVGYNMADGKNNQVNIRVLYA